MKRRISLTIDPEIHQRAKRLAARRGTSVSGLFAKLIDQESPAKESIVDRMAGVVKLRDPKPGEDPLFDRLKEKYLHD